MTRRRAKAVPAAPANPTITEAQLAAELARWAQNERSAAIAVCSHALDAAWHPAELVQVLRTLGLIPDPEAGVPGKYAWGQVKRGQQ